MDILRILAPIARRRQRLLRAILIVNLALIAGALGAVGVLSEGGSSRIAPEKVIAPRIMEAEMRRLWFIGRRRRRISASSRFHIARIISLNGILIVTLRLRQRRLRPILIGVPAEVRIAATLLLTLPRALVLVEIRSSPVTR